MSLEIGRCPEGYAVFEAGRRVSGFYSHHLEAERRLDVMKAQRRRQAGTRKRKCMCCGNEFLSEGIHNRLCKCCRQSVGRLGNEMGA